VCQDMRAADVCIPGLVECFSDGQLAGRDEWVERAACIVDQDVEMAELGRDGLDGLGDGRVG